MIVGIYRLIRRTIAPISSIYANTGELDLSNLIKLLWASTPVSIDRLTPIDRRSLAKFRSMAENPKQPIPEAATLLAQIAARERSALARLYDLYARTIYAIAQKSLNSVEDSEEIVLEVFTQIWKIADRFDPHKGSAEQWIFTLARSRIIDRLRKFQRLQKVNDVIVAGREIDFPTISVDPIEAVEIVDRRNRVMAALSQIPAEQRQAIELAYYQGLTHTEIAAKIGLSLGTVKTRLRLGLSKLKSIVDRD